MNEMRIERVYVSAVEQANAINAAADRSATRHDMASLYVDCIIAEKQTGEGIDWKAVHTAILSRWSRSGLLFIKKRAWKLLESIQ